MKVEKYLIASYQGENYPFIKITDDLAEDGKRRNIRIDFFDQHHISLHEAEIIEEGDSYYRINLHGNDTKFPKTYLGKLPIIFTSKDQNKPKSSWDEEIINIAECCKLGGNKPETHREYYEDRPLPLGNTVEYFLLGKTIRLAKRKEYPQGKSIFCRLNKKTFFVKIFFSVDQFRKNINLGLEFDTSMGKLGFVFSESGVKDNKVIKA